MNFPSLSLARASQTESKRDGLFFEEPVTLIPSSGALNLND